MHNLWEEMLPFYIAGALPQAEARRLERHLEHCAPCSQSMNEWKLVAAAVRAEAASQMRALPALSADVLREASQRMQSRVYQTADVPRLVQKPRQSGTTRTSALATQVSVALVAAFTVLVIGGVLALMLTSQPNPNADSVVLLPSATMTETALPVTDVPTTQVSVTEIVPTALPSSVPQIIVIEPSATPTVVLPTRVPPTSAPPPTQLSFVPPPTQMIPAQNFPTFLPPPTTTPFVEEALAMSIGMGGGGGCTAQAAIPSGSVINLYALPRTDATVLTTISSADALTALAVSDNSWYQVQSAAGNVGWVQQGLVSASGNCDSLPVIPMETATDGDATPTETVLPFPTLEATTGQD